MEEGIVAQKVMDVFGHSVNEWNVLRHGCTQPTIEWTVCRDKQLCNYRANDKELHNQSSSSANKVGKENSAECARFNQEMLKLYQNLKYQLRK